MNWIENLLIVAGLSLDIFAAMECQGSLVAKVNKKQLSCICVLVAIGQVVGLFLGHFLSSLYCRKNPATNEQLLGEIVSMLIFMGLGARLLVKAIRNEQIEERLENNLDMRRFVRMTCGTAIYTVLAGIAFGFLETNIAIILIMAVIVTVAFVIGGMYIGYRCGFNSKTIVYGIGTALLWVAGVDVLIRKILCGS